MEVLSCLACAGSLGGEEADANLRVAWEPDEWGIDLDWTQHQHLQSARVNDEAWTQKILYIVAKIINFRAAGKAEGSLIDSPMVRQTRVNEWHHLKSLLETWQRHSPRSMHPVGYIDPSPTSSFPEVWLLKRTAIMARLLFHTGLVLLSQMYPQASNREQEMSKLRCENALLICGIVARNKDRGVASMAIRALAIAGEVITDPIQQRELLQVLGGVAQSTGWNVQTLVADLSRNWGWPSEQDNMPQNTTTTRRATSVTLAPQHADQMLRPGPEQIQVSGAVAPEIAPPPLMHAHPQQQLPKNYPLAQHHSPPPPTMMRRQQTATPPQQQQRSRGSRSRSNTMGVVNEFPVTTAQQLPAGYPAHAHAQMQTGIAGVNVGTGGGRPYYG